MRVWWRFPPHFSMDVKMVYCVTCGLSEFLYGRRNGDENLRVAHYTLFHADINLKQRHLQSKIKAQLPRKILMYWQHWRCPTATGTISQTGYIHLRKFEVRKM